jgi:PAS domain S-box-containing protein
METEGVVTTELHEALVYAMASPIVAVDQDGTVVEWNHAAETCTGIFRSEALGTPIWNIQARIAPAVVPYEEALSRSRDHFLSLVARSEQNRNEWKEEFDWDILSTRGELRHLHTRVFPLVVRDHLVIVNVLCGRTRLDGSPQDIQQALTGC